MRSAAPHKFGTNPLQIMTHILQQAISRHTPEDIKLYFQIIRAPKHLSDVTTDLKPLYKQ